MSPAPRVVAFVHAKGSSERVPGKNLRTLGDRPLFCHAIDHARSARGVDLVVIDSDDERILEVGVRHGAVKLRRPAALASNSASGDDLAYWQASNYPDAELVVQVVPTAPFLQSETISRAVETLGGSTRDSLVAVYQEPLFIWNDAGPTYYRDGRILNSSELAPTLFETTGLYANRCEFVLRERRRLNPNSCHLMRVSRMESVDINTEEDFAFAEALWRGLHC